MTAYPAQTRYVARACEKLGLRFVDLDQGGGYLFAVSDGTHEFVGGSGAICTYPLNAASAFGISRDKHHANAVLARAGIATIPGELFFLDERTAQLRAPGRERADALAAFANGAPPFFCKPNQGSRGDFAEIVSDMAAFRDYLDRVSRRYDAILLQPVFEGDEYRVFCLDGKPIFAARKREFMLEGDGKNSLHGLLQRHNASLAGTGVSPIDIQAALGSIALRHDVSSGHVPAKGERIALPGRRNLSAGGDIEEFTTRVPRELSELALRATKALGLRVAGVDVFDTSPARDLSRLVAIEINGNPGIQSLEAIGRDDLIDEIWTQVLSRTFAECRK